MTTEQTLELWMDVDDADAEELERLAVQLRRQLEELEVEAVEPVPGDAAPEGAKALDWVVIGGLLVKLGPGAGPRSFTPSRHGSRATRAGA